MKLEEVILRDTRANQPAANAVPIGTIYFVTDEELLERSNGITWDSYSGGAGLGEVTVTTTGNIDDLNIGSDSFVLLRMNNATLSTIRGMIPGVANQIVKIVSVGAGQVDLSHQDTNEATATRRLLNFVTTGITPLAAGVGTAIYQYDDTTDRWRLIEHEQGAFIDVPFNAGDFTSGGTVTWTVEAGDLNTFKYYLKGRLLTLAISITGSATTGVASSPNLFILLPNGYTFSTGTILSTMRYTHASTNSAGTFLASSVTSVTQLIARLVNNGNWPGNVAVNIYGQGTFQID